MRSSIMDNNRTTTVTMTASEEIRSIFHIRLDETQKRHIPHDEAMQGLMDAAVMLAKRIDQAYELQDVRYEVVKGLVDRAVREDNNKRG